MDIAVPFYENGTIGIDRVFEASLRLLEAELAVAKSSDERLRRYVAHRDRMRLLASQFKRTPLGSVDARPDAAFAEYYLAEAEYWLAREVAER